MLLLPCLVEVSAPCKKSHWTKAQIWDIQPSKRREKVILDILTVCLAVAFLADSHGRKG